jgi:ABC-2 type transport system ATP-binding protein
VTQITPGAPAPVPHAPPPPPPPDASAVDAIITVREVSKVYGDQRALDDINLDVPRGAIVGVIGPSGCGKTTLVRSLTGIEVPSEGEVRVFGVDPAKFGRRDRMRFGYMPQLPVLFPNLSVWGNLGFIASVYAMPLRGRRRRLMALLDLVDLTQHRDKKLSDCSGGMQRRLTLAATLVHEPELLYLDEPTAGVDPILRERFWSHFRTLRDQGKTIVVPTQYVNEAVSCDLVAVMAAGRLLTVQEPGNLSRVAYGGDLLHVHFDGGWVRGTELAQLATFDFIDSVSRTDSGVLVSVDDSERDMQRLRDFFESSGVAVSEIEVYEPSYDEMFVRLIERYTSADERSAA